MAIYYITAYMRLIIEKKMSFMAKLVSSFMAIYIIYQINVVLQKLSSTNQLNRMGAFQYKLDASMKNESTLKWLLHNTQSEVNFLSLEEYKSIDLSREIPQTHTLKRDLDGDSLLRRFERDVTILIYSADESLTCLTYRLNSVHDLFPNTKIHIVSRVFEPQIVNSDVITVRSGVVWTEGEAFNYMIQTVTTEYFLYLSTGISLSTSDNEYNSSPISLFHYLLSINELDFIGGAILRHKYSSRHPTLEVPCYRLQTCQWVFQQSFQYKYSVDDMMVCEETSSSFMGRVSSLGKVGLYDEKLTTMTTTDFFFRAKNKAVVGLRPEFKFHISQTCQNIPNIRLADVKYFLKKYDVLIFKSANSEKVVLNETREAIRNDEIYKKEMRGGLGSPDRVESLNTLLAISDDYFNLHENGTYYVEGGCALGGIKTRNVMPWDVSNDIDTIYHTPWATTLQKMRRFVSRGYDGRFRLHTEYRSKNQRQIQLIDRHNDIRDTYFTSATDQYHMVISPEEIMYITIGSREIPVRRVLFSYFREQYNLTYLETRGKTNDPIQCSSPGHHACVPEALLHGGGYWSDFFCRL